MSENGKTLKEIHRASIKIKGEKRKSPAPKSRAGTLSVSIINHHWHKQ